MSRESRSGGAEAFFFEPIAVKHLNCRARAVPRGGEERRGGEGVRTQRKAGREAKCAANNTGLARREQGERVRVAHLVSVLSDVLIEQ